MRILILFFLSYTVTGFGQISDTINGFNKKIAGEEIVYFSPLHQFAKTALLTRMNGKMPIEWESPKYAGNKKFVTYEFLIGHSSGTSSANRLFDVSLNGQLLFSIETPQKKKGPYLLNYSKNEISYSFELQEYDDNGDAFGKLLITVPSERVQTHANFKIVGQNENSNDWLMVFMYRAELEIIVEPTNLVTRTENLRQLNVFVNNPYPNGSTIVINSDKFQWSGTIDKGYNKLSIPAYQEDFIGNDSIQIVFNENKTLYSVVELKPIKEYFFHIIHHSHNDIGYSHLQTEVAKIQTQNIRSAIQWIEANKRSKTKPVWHIESLWAVENFLNAATKKEEKQFVKAVKSGQLVLSANYANVLTGLCQKNEMNWIVEYAKILEKKYGFTIQNAMMTDIPGITYSGLLTYVNNGIPYLSLGPNYFEAYADHGDRVGGVIREQGDKMFYWKADSLSEKKVLVWTAGKGYSFFHSIRESEKLYQWEKRISDYSNELSNKNYPYELVQLRYTKKADNGPVDTALIAFVEEWNKHFKTPQLVISSVNTLFGEFEKKYGSTIPTFSGEITPYWEDGAYSTAVEEMENRDLVLKTLSMEEFAKQSGQYEDVASDFYKLHRNIVLFHEHTWGSWCSVSDPEIFFTTEQWKIKKSFLDSAKVIYSNLTEKLGFIYQSKQFSPNQSQAIEFEVNPASGGLNSIFVNGKNIAFNNITYDFFEPVYALGINPTVFHSATNIKVNVLEDSELKKIVSVTFELPSLKNAKIQYSLLKAENRLVCKYIFDKEIEKNKESMHIALPFDHDSTQIFYGSDSNLLQFNVDQLPGSNKDFFCSETEVQVKTNNYRAIINSPKINLFEVGEIIDETRINGSKVWKTENDNTSTLFLYVFNNYWHTNYKAYQDGYFEFEVELRFE